MMADDLDHLIRAAWRRSDLRERLYNDIDVTSEDYLEEMLIAVAKFGYDAHRLDIWLNPFRLKSSLDAVFNPNPQTYPQHSAKPSPPMSSKDVAKKSP